MTETTYLGLPFIEDSQAQKHVTHNEALRILDAVIQIAVEDVTRTTPPSSPAEGQRHVVASGPSGAWAGHAGAIATWQDGAWVFLTPKTGWCLWSVADVSIFIFDGAGWQPLAPLANDVGRLGVNTTASTPNLLSVKSNAALLAAITTADGGSGDARLQIAKAAAGNTASVVFSDNYSARAEFGLTGDDHFHLKVSPDGTSWQDAFVIDKTTANVSFNGFTDAAATRRQLNAPVRTITGSDTIITSDIGGTLLFNSTSAITVTITAAATLGNGFWCRFKNVNSGVVTIDPSSTEAIDGNATTIVPKFDSGILVCDGTGFHTLERPPIVLLGSGNFSSSSSLNLVLPAGYAELDVNLSDVKPSAASTVMGCVSKDGGATWVTGYTFSRWYQQSGSTTAPLYTDGATTQNYMTLSGTGDSGNSGISSKIMLDNLTSAVSFIKTRFESQIYTGGVPYQVFGQNQYSGYDPYNMLQLFPYSGSWSSGSWQFYGKRKMV